MTNHDFWMSIDNIINEGFTSEGLAKLDDYAEKFSTGEILYKRFSPSEQYGCCQGGAIHVIASLLAGAEVSPNQLSTPEGSFKRNIIDKYVKSCKAKSCSFLHIIFHPQTISPQNSILPPSRNHQPCIYCIALWLDSHERTLPGCQRHPLRTGGGCRCPCPSLSSPHQGHRCR